MSLLPNSFSRPQCGKLENRAADVEGIYWLEPKKEPIALHIKVVQCLQSSEALSIDLDVQHSERVQYLGDLYETNLN